MNNTTPLRQAFPALVKLNQLKEELDRIIKTIADAEGLNATMPGGSDLYCYRLSDSISALRLQALSSREIIEERVDGFIRRNSVIRNSEVL